MPLTPMTAEELGQMRARAAQSRKAQSQALSEVRSGALPVASALTKPGPAQRIKVRTLLLAAKGIGPAKADRLLTDAGIHESRRRSVRVQGLGAKQRERLAALLA